MFEAMMAGLALLAAGSTTAAVSTAELARLQASARIVDAIRKGCTSVAKVGACTKAGTGCQSCKGVVSQLIDAYRDN